MALDWNKPISFGKKRNAKVKSLSAGGAYPTKTTMNLMSVQDVVVDKKKVAIVGVIVGIVAILFIKFAVIDQFMNVSAKQAEYENAQATLFETQADLAGYNDVLKEYQQYSGAANGGGTIPDALVVVDMVNSVIGKEATITGINMKDKTVAVDVKGVSLQRVGELNAKLSAQKIVNSVSVSTADNKNSKNVNATLTMTLVGQTEAEINEASKSTSDAAAAQEQ